jgi:hypothetical protein
MKRTLLLAAEYALRAIVRQLDAIRARNERDE